MKALKERFLNFPITAFAMVMGISGFSIVLSKFWHLGLLPHSLFLVSAWISLFLFISFVLLYGYKSLYHTEAVVADFKHVIRINFFSTISISLLLLSIIFYSIYPMLGLVFWWIGTLLHTFFTLHTIRFWIQHNFEIHFINPAWFIPVVGTIIIPIVGVEMLAKEVSWFYFGAGFFFWIILLTINLYRIIFHAQLPEKFIPTFFILLAPPAIGFISYMRIAMSWDLFSSFLLFFAFFMTLLILFLYKSFRKLKFFMSWWAFTFPLDALTLASVVAYQVTGNSFYKNLSWLLLIVAIIVITIVAWLTIQNIRMKNICIKED